MSTPAPLTGPYVRVVRATAIGDPPATDLCSGVDLTALAKAGFGGDLDTEQSPPGCELRLVSKSVDITIEALRSPSTRQTTRTTRSGQTVYEHAYYEPTGDCRRDIAARGVTLSVNVFPNPFRRNFPEASACGPADLVTAQLAAAVTRRTFRPLPIAHPSVTSSDACAVVRATRTLASAPFRGAKAEATNFGAGCLLQSPRLTLSLEPVLATLARPTATVPVRIDGRLAYRASLFTPTYCEYTLTLARTSAGRWEQVHLISAAKDVNKPVPGMCAQTQHTLSRYVLAAGLG